MWLLIIALFGITVPNGLFIYWLVFEYPGIRPLLENTVAVAFMIDAFVATGLLAFLFARTLPGRVGWAWFVIFSLAGGLAFSIPFYLWLNGYARK